MRAPADIAVYDENDQISALVEVRAVPESTPEWAMRIRRDVLEESAFTPKYFLAVARDWSYFWTSPKPCESGPDQIVSTGELFEKYLNDINSTAQSIAPSSLELMVGIWLNDLAQQAQPASHADVVEQSGLPSAIAHGRVEFLAAA